MTASRRAEARARPIAARRSAAPSAKRRQHFLAEEADLLVPVGSPQLEHDVRAARLAVLLDRGDALVRRAGDRLATVEQGIGHLLFRGETAAALHRLRDRSQLAHLDLGGLEQRVRSALDVLELVGEIHAADLPGALAAGV